MNVSKFNLFFWAFLTANMEYKIRDG